MDGEPASDLDRIAPQTVLDLYLSERESDLAWRTRRSHRYVLERFVNWCDENDVRAVVDLDGRTLQKSRDCCPTMVKGSPAGRMDPSGAP